MLPPRARIVLASASPRRASILTEAGFAFDVVAPNVDETVEPGVSPDRAAILLAARKCDAVAAVAGADAFVLAADTLLDLDGEVGGKPRDEDHARAMLRALSGRAHAVWTGVALARAGVTRTGIARSDVTFRSLDDADIDAYVRTGEPLDKAGAYAIQGGARDFVARVDGPLDNVIGLPMGVVTRLLSDAGYPRV